MPQHQDLKLLRPLRTTTQNQQLEQTADNPVSEGQTLKQQTSNTHLPTLPGRTTPSTPPSPSAHAPQKPPNEFVGPTGLEGNVSARSAPPPEAACDAEAEELSTNGAEDKWSSWAVPGLPRLPAVAAVQAAGCSRPACESQPRVGFPGVAARLFTLAAAAQMAKHRSEPAAEPNFFTPQPKIWFRLQIELIRWGGQNFGCRVQKLSRRRNTMDLLAGRAEPPPERKDVRDRRPHLLVGAEDDPAYVVPVEPDRQAERELAPLGLVAQTTVQAGADQVQLGLRHRALESEQQPVVEVARRVDAVLVGDQGARERAKIEQPMPIGRGAGKARDLEREHDPDLAQPDRGRKLLEADPSLARRAGAARVLVDDGDRLPRPAELDRALNKPVLARSRLDVRRDLSERRLPDIDDRAPPAMLLGDLRPLTHRARPPKAAPPAAPA